MRVFTVITICVTSLVAAACSGTDAVGPQTGEVGGECSEGDICDPGLRCVSGYCVPDEGETDTTDGPAADGNSDDSSGPANGNQAPTVAITAPSEGETVQLGDVVTLTATLSDDRDAPETLSATWASDLSGALGTSDATTSGLTTLETDALVGGLHTLAVTVTDSQGLQATATLTLTVNAPPGAPTLTISPEGPTTTDDLTVTITEAAEDPNRDSGALTSTYSWYRDSALQANHTGPFLPASATQKGELWQVRVSAFDGFLQGPEGTAQVEIQNTPPSCSQAVMLPSAGSTTTEFTCSCVERSDADDDAPADTCTFKDGDAELTTVDAIEGTCTLPASMTERGMAITCTLTPADDEASGDPVQSDEVIVQNALPTTPAAELTPLEGTVETLFTCTQTGESTDADGDTLTYQTSWVVNGYENPGTTTTSVTAAQVATDEAGTPAKRGDTLSCRLRASDGQGLSQPAESNAVVLGNSPPTGGSVITGPPGAKEGDVLTCQATEAEDLDGDPITWTIAWFVGDAEVEGETDTTLTSDHFDKGDTVHCVATPSDGTDAGEPVESKLSVVIQNTLPSIATATLTPDQTSKTGSFTCAFEGWSDPDPADSEPTVTYAWYLAIEGEDDTLVEGATEAELSAAAFVPGTQLYCRVTPINGDDAGEAIDSGLGLVINTKPTLDTVTLTPEEAYADSLLTCTPEGGADLDGDPVSYLYSWQLNGEPVDGATEATLSGVFEKGNTLRCAAVPFDGYEEGAAKLSNPVTIGNKLPLITGVTLSPAYGAPCDTFMCEADDIIDPDEGDNLVKGYSWTLNGEPVAEQSPTLSSALLAPGDILQCAVSATDGTVGPPPDFANVVVSATSNEAQVYNTPPSLDGALIAEAAPFVGDTLHCEPQGFSDAECDPTPDFVFAWFVGTTQLEGESAATLETSGLGVGVEIACRAIPFDGYDYGAPALSDPVTLQNLAPDAPVVSLSAPEGADGDATCVLADEVEGLSYTYYWSVNGTDEVTGEAVRPAAETHHCDHLACRAVADDGYDQVSSNTAEAQMAFGADCDDDNVCTTDGCLETGGCSAENNTLGCEDGDACTEGDLCSGGACQPGGAVNCDDGLFCNGAESCDASAGCQSGTPPVLDDGVGCTDDACDEISKTVLHTPNDSLCDNTLFCDGAETCHPTDDCQPGTPPVLDDGVACTDDACDETSDTVLHTPNDSLCDNTLFCDGTETCHLTDDCQPGTPPSINDGVGCTDDGCDEDTDQITHTPNDGLCDNTLFCDGTETCHLTEDCQPGAPPELNDGVGCTDDACDETSDTVLHTPNHGLCDNTLFCDGAETCHPIDDCQPGASPELNDGVGCTDDACDETSDTVLHTPNDGLCDNTLFCDGQETCHPTDDCQPGTPPTVNDDVGCTDDACDETGDVVTHTPNDAHCTTGALCLTDTCDLTDDCVSSAIPDCCGNNIQEGGEECDDGNTADSDGCESDCTLSFCLGDTIALFKDLPWPDAENDCVNRGGHLVWILSEAENQVVSELCDTYKGITSVNTGCLLGMMAPFTTWFSGHPVGYTKWGPSKDGSGPHTQMPKSNGGDWMGHWDDVDNWPGGNGHICRFPSGTTPELLGADASAELPADPNCSFCGNGQAEGDEQCDDGPDPVTTCAYGEQSCQACNASCELVAGEVTGYCGDGVEDTDNGEECDEGIDPVTTCADDEESCLVCNASCELVEGEVQCQDDYMLTFSGGSTGTCCCTGGNSDNSYILAAVSPELSGASTATIEFWLYLDTYTQYGAIMKSEGTGNSGMGITNTSDCGYGSNRYKTNGGWGGDGIFSQTSATLGTWQHYAIVFDNGTNRYFVDGVLQGTASATSSTTPAIPNDRLYFGGSWAASNGNNQHQVNGSYRAIRISSTARYTVNFTPDDSLVADADTLHLYGLDEGTGYTVYDSVGALTGTIVNGSKANETWSMYEPCP